MFGQSSVFQILVRIEVKTSIMVSPTAWTNSAGTLSTPADFSSFSALIAASPVLWMLDYCLSDVLPRKTGLSPE